MRIPSFYLPGRGLLHACDARVKLLLLLPFAVLFFLPLSLRLLAAYLGVLAGSYLLFLGPRELARTLRSLLPVIVLVLLLTPPFHPQGRPLLVVFSRPLVTWEGIRESLALAGRFTGLSLLFLLLLRTTDPDQLILSLRWLGVPFETALVITITLRMIPSLAALYENVLDAHRLRRADEEPSGRGALRRLAQVLPVLTSVLIQAVKGIPLLAMALESRGLGRKNPRTSLLELKSSSGFRRDLAAGLFILLLVLAPLLFFPSWKN